MPQHSNQCYPIFIYKLWNPTDMEYLKINQEKEQQQQQQTYEAAYVGLQKEKLVSDWGT